MTFADSINANVSFVLPTYRYFDQTTKEISSDARAEITAFLQQMHNAGYFDRISVLELGNEFYDTRFGWTLEEFADFQVEFADIVGDFLNTIPATDRPAIYAQAARAQDGDAPNQILADAFGSALNMIDGVVTHGYVANGEGNSLDVGGGFNNRLGDIREVWGNNLGLAVTEWNVGANNANEEGEYSSGILGFERLAPLLRTFTSLVDNEVDLATFWTTHTPGYVGLAHYDNGTNVYDTDLTPTGYFYRMLHQNIIGMELDDPRMNQNLEVNDQHVGYSYTFRSNEQVVLYFSSGVSVDHTVEADLTSIIGNRTGVHVQVTYLEPVSGNLDAIDVDALLRNEDISNQVLNNNRIEFDLDGYEMVQIVVTFSGGVFQFGDDANAVDETFNGTNRQDEIHGGMGNDVINGSGSFDTLTGGDGADTINGGNHADNLFGGIGNDSLYGGQGFDRLFGENGNDRLFGGNDTDALFGGVGNDTLRGEGGDDRFFGGSGNDRIIGGQGNDTLHGNAGFDEIIGGAGNDIITGFFNADTFIFESGHGQDTITDFDATNNFERIDLSAIQGLSFGGLQLNSATQGAAIQAGNNVEINTGGANVIVLQNVSLSDLDSNDFIF